MKQTGLRGVARSGRDGCSPTVSAPLDSYAWKKRRVAIRKRDKGLCQECLRNGRYTPGRDVDHIKPRFKGGSDDPSNLQLLCVDCHTAKTIADTGGKQRAKIGADGWPE
ncbi:MAG: HNH endonuclease [Paracoccaceae bacterium]